MDIHEISNELLIKASNGDINAFEEIYKAGSVFVYNVSFRIVGNREDAQEAAQEVFLRLFENLKNFKFQSSFPTWLYRVTVNTALNVRKKASTYLNRQVQFDDNIDVSAVVDDQAEKSIDKRSNEELVNSLLETLNPEQRACVVLRDMQGLSYQEIAEALDININTVRSRLKRARESLMKEGLKAEREGKLTGKY